MNQGAEILLKRMDSHPEEFAMDLDHPWQRGEEKWSGITSTIYNRAVQIYVRRDPNNLVGPETPPALPFLTDEEILTLYHKLMSVQGDSFTAQVVKRLLEDKQEKNDVADVASYFPHTSVGIGNYNSGSAGSSAYPTQYGKVVQLP